MCAGSPGARLSVSVLTAAITLFESNLRFKRRESGKVRAYFHQQSAVHGLNEASLPCNRSLLFLR